MQSKTDQPSPAKSHEILTLYCMVPAEAFQVSSRAVQPRNTTLLTWNAPQQASAAAFRARPLAFQPWNVTLRARNTARLASKKVL
jgi:hypothetical protein